MDIKTLMNERHAALEAVEGMLQEELIAARLNEPDDKNDIEVLTVIFPELGLDGDSALAELFFLPIVSEEAQVQHFNTVITIADDLEEERFPALYEAISYINFRLVCGAYALDEESGSLVFKLSVPMPIDLQGDDLIREINICSGNAVAVLDQHIDLVLGIANGEVTMDDIKDTWTSGTGV